MARKKGNMRTLDRKPPMKKNIRNIAKFILFSACLILCASNTQATEKSRGALRIATFNLRQSPPGREATFDGGNCWNNRKKLASELIRFYEFDICATQEGWKNQLDYLAPNSGEYKWIGLAREDGKEKGEHSAILYNTKKLELLDSGTFWFSETPDTPSKGWDAACTRVCTWGKFRQISSQKVFFVLNSHFDHVGKIARIKEAEMLIKFAEEIAKGAPVFLTGDLNSLPESDVIEIITKSQKFFDSIGKSESAPYGPIGTFHGFSGKSGKGKTASSASEVGKERIDYIFVSEGISVKKYAILTNSDNLKFPSDHFPVMVEVELAD